MVHHEAVEIGCHHRRWRGYNEGACIPTVCVCEERGCGSVTRSVHLSATRCSFSYVLSPPIAMEISSSPAVQLQHKHNRNCDIALHALCDGPRVGHRVLPTADQHGAARAEGEAGHGLVVCKPGPQVIPRGDLAREGREWSRKYRVNKAPSQRRYRSVRGWRIPNPSIPHTSRTHTCPQFNSFLST